MRRGRYYLGRVVKINLSQDELMNSIVNAPIVTIGKFDWTITDIVDNRQNEKAPYIFGKVSKYAKHGHVIVIDELHRSQVDTDAPNLLEASSPFVYLPECSGIAFLHVWNGIDVDVFPRRFKSIVEAAHNNFFVACDVETITDYRAFTTRLKKLNYFTEFSAKVYPPNPLFGRLWKNLNNYIKDRNASEISIKEQTSKPEGLHSKIIELMDSISDNSEYEPEITPDIGDAALLMAADGYGHGKVIGIKNNEEVIVKTSDTQESFLHDQEPTPSELAEQTNTTFKAITKERDMKH